MFDAFVVQSAVARLEQPLFGRLLQKPDGQVGGALQRPGAYRIWIDAREAEVNALPETLRGPAKTNIASCREAHDRMCRGAVRITEDAAMSRAFQLTNLAMDMQYGWGQSRQGKEKPAPLEWRPFQLGFVLLAASSVADRESPERRVMDLLWFPTGGGKTEAYLALIAFLAFYRRLGSEQHPDTGAGVAAIMRYTLRLLTTQQFVRAASVLLACEAIRRERVPKANTSVEELGSTPFSVGLWVGGSAVPNSVDAAAAALGQSPDQPTPRQLVSCPACGESLDWSYNGRAHAIYVRCSNQDCLLFDAEAPLPVWTVDEDVYRVRPTLLIGTIDKFAQIVRRKEISNLFGLHDGSPPDLVLQDELHLIAGLLGNVAGLYEVAIDRLFETTEREKDHRSAKPPNARTGSTWFP